MRVLRLRLTPVAVAVSVFFLVSLGLTLDALLSALVTPNPVRHFSQPLDRGFAEDRLPVGDEAAVGVGVGVSVASLSLPGVGGNSNALGPGTDGPPRAALVKLEQTQTENSERLSSSGSGHDEAVDNALLALRGHMERSREALEGSSDASTLGGGDDGATSADGFDPDNESLSAPSDALDGWYAQLRQLRAAWKSYGRKSQVQDVDNEKSDKCKNRASPSTPFVVHSDGPLPCKPYEFVGPVRSKYTTEAGLECFGPGFDAVKDGSCVCKTGWTGATCDIPFAVAASPGHEGVSRSPPVRIVDCFNFNMEADLLRIRLKELRGVVDAHVIVEARVSLAGTPKALRFAELAPDVIAEYGDRIIYVVIDSAPEGIARLDGGFAILNVGYSAVGQLGLPAIAGLSDRDLVLFGDVDEIPDSRVIGYLREHTTGLPLHTSIYYRWSYYGFMWRNSRGVHLSSVVTMHHLKNALSWDSIKIRGRPAEYDRSYWVIGNGNVFAGWHCSWCFPVSAFVVKLDSAIHGDYPRWGDYAEKKEIGYLQENKRLGRWFDGTVGGTLTTPATDAYMAPQWALDNQPLFRYLFDRNVPDAL
eukprot:Opistho-2@64610